MGALMAVRFFFTLFGIGIVLGLFILSPLPIGQFFGHDWGACTSIFTVAFWIYVGFKITMAPFTRMMWLFGVVLSIVLGVREFLHS
jgi:hypothetical protein